MMTMLKAGVASALAVAACFALPVTASAADLYGESLKDGGYAPLPAVTPQLAGPCYVRGDVGYSWKGDPNPRYVGNAVGEEFHSASIDGSVVYDVGIGCSSGSRGFRGEIDLGFRQSNFKGDADIVLGGAPVDPPFKANIDTYTAMINGYYDFGNFRGFVPYVGAGVGFALHDVGYVTIDNPASPNPQYGETKASLAWAVMAGVGYQINNNLVLDVGYRYIDLGSAQSGIADTALVNNPRLVINDLTAHEFKVGLRYHFNTNSASSCCNYAPVK